MAVVEGQAASRALAAQVVLASVGALRHQPAGYWHHCPHAKALLVLDVRESTQV
jgi:hypothetical protein